ncbi:MAG: FtsQ-type POTRA domain-containing protein [Gemmatimonadales bacterium]|nr:FtsQ-type POTRA domain-containing protein [Gemmatimonadales bacterium]
MRPAVRAALAVLGIGVAAGLGYGAWQGLRSLAFFKLRRVEVLGLEHGDARAVVAALRLPVGASTFDRLGDLGARVAALDGVAEATVERRLPGTLVVRVREREAVALVPAARRLALLAADGTLLPFPASRGAVDLPVLETPDSLAARFLARLGDEAPALFARVERGRREGEDMVLEEQGRRWRFRAAAGGEAFRDGAAVAADLARRGIAWRELDARLEGQVVVRRAGA